MADASDREGSDRNDQDLPRRSFLDLLLAAGVVGSAAAAAFPILRYLKPLPSSAGGGPTQLTAEERAKIDSQSFVITSAGNKRVIVFRDGQGNLRALDAKCTHEGCTVQYVPGESIVWCACHNGRFDLDGRVLSGPPPKPLPEYTALTQDDGTIVVSVESA